MSALEGKISSQAVGAFGEWSAVCELLRRGWIPANVNGTVKNAENFDIYALKHDRQVRLRVRACQPGSRAFRFGGFQAGKPVPLQDFEESDFTVLVSIGQKRDDDEFFIMPSRAVREEIIQRQGAWISKPKRDGSERKDTGPWTLRLDERKDGTDEGGWGLARKWAQYRENWNLLES